MSKATLITVIKGERQPDVEFEDIKPALVALMFCKNGSYVHVLDPKPLQVSIYRKIRGEITIAGIHEAPPELNIGLLQGASGFTSHLLEDGIVMSKERVYAEVQKSLKSINAVMMDMPDAVM